MITCPRCQAEQLPNTLFCDSCGETLHERDQSGETPSYSMVRMELLDSRRVITLPDVPELIIGRSSSNPAASPDLALDQYGGEQSGVSRHHARLSRRGLHLYLEDLGSLNGTFINESKLPPAHPTRIYPGDVVRLGLLRVAFNIRQVGG